MKKDERRLFAHRFQDESIFVHTTDEDINPWDRTRIVAVLVNETGIDYRLADQISEEIQSIIFSSGIKVVTSELVRELVNAKLIEHRFEKARDRNRRLGLSLHDAGFLMRFPPAVQSDMSGTAAVSGALMAETMKRQYALSDVFPVNLHRPHLEGRLHIHGISSPDRPYMAAVDARLVVKLGMSAGNTVIRCPRSPEGLMQNILKLDSLLRVAVGRRVSWHGLEDAFRSLGATDDQCAELIQQLIRSRSAFSCSPMAARTVFALSDPGMTGKVIRMMEQEMITNVQVTASRDAWFPSPYLTLAPESAEGHQFTLEAVTLNLPGLGIRSIIEDSPLEAEGRSLVEKAASIFAQKRVFLEKLCAVRPDGPMDILIHLGFKPAEAECVVGVCGLNELVRTMKDGDLDEGESRYKWALQRMKEIRQLVHRTAESRRLPMVLGTADQGQAAYRFARLDLKFQPYYASRILNGDIAEAAVYYSHDGCLPSDKPVELKRKLRLEGGLQQMFDRPFLSIIKARDPVQVAGDDLTDSLHHLLLTADFSLCYNCFTMDSGIYRTCPNCHNTEVGIFRATSEGYDSGTTLSRAERLEQERSFFY